ncbi:putative permease [Neisseria flavescens]|nr:putative permease [Neisseria meningitidis]SPY11503.1 putative permease [Neisseria meningitidis]STZ66095.1 putative permease [Neisseria flavescens]
MSFSIALPLVYLFIGILIGKSPFRKIKGTFSVILSRWIIPFVIVYNITTYRDGMQYVMDDYFDGVDYPNREKS